MNQEMFSTLMNPTVNPRRGFKEWGGFDEIVAKKDWKLKARMPWTQSKGFANSAIVGNFSEPPVGLSHMRLELAINGNPRQESSIGEMRFSPLELIDELSTWAPIDAGDLLFCGTPAGVGPMQRGDHVQARLLSEDGTILSELDFLLA